MAVRFAEVALAVRAAPHHTPSCFIAGRRSGQAEHAARITISPVVVSLVAIAASRLHVYLSTLLFPTVPLYHLSHRRIDENSPGGEVAGDEFPGTGPKAS